MEGKGPPFRVPPCRQHAKIIFGVDTRPSPLHGCGLFACGAFRKDDIILPYTGETFNTLADVRRAQNRTNSPYLAVTGVPTGYTESSCLRGWASLANHSDPNRVSPNVIGIVGTLRLDRCHPDNNHAGWSQLAYASTPKLHRRAKRVRQSVLDIFHGRSYLWLMATRPIAPGDEIIWRYPDGGPTTTVPSLCTGGAGCTANSRQPW